MGMHTGTPRVVIENDRIDYFGPMVNQSARVEGKVFGGQVLVSQPVLSELQQSDVAFVPRSIGEHVLKGSAKPMELFCVRPPALQGRTFPAVEPNKVCDKCKSELECPKCDRPMAKPLPPTGLGKSASVLQSARSLMGATPRHGTHYRVQPRRRSGAEQV